MSKRWGREIWSILLKILTLAVFYQPVHPWGGDIHSMRRKTDSFRLYTTYFWVGYPRLDTKVFKVILICLANLTKSDLMNFVPMVWILPIRQHTGHCQKYQTKKKLVCTRRPKQKESFTVCARSGVQFLMKVKPCLPLAHFVLNNRSKEITDDSNGER